MNPRSKYRTEPEPMVAPPIGQTLGRGFEKNQLKGQLTEAGLMEICVVCPAIFCPTSNVAVMDGVTDGVRVGVNVDVWVGVIVGVLLGGSVGVTNTISLSN